MSDTTGEHYGPALASYIDSLRGDTSVRQFAAQHGLDDARISTWRSGANPGLGQLRQVATGLQIPLGELLIAIGLGSTADFTVVTGPKHVSIAEAVETDPNLLDHERAMLRDVLVMLQKLRDGAETVTIASKRRGRKS